MKRALRAIFSLLLIAAFVQSAQVIIAAGTPDIFKELGKQIKDDISNELRNGSEMQCEMLLTKHVNKRINV